LLQEKSGVKGGSANLVPLGSVGCEAERTEKGEAHIWLEERWVNKLAALRGPGESYSDVILRLAAVGLDPLNGS
jgi:hypothetical protein